MKTPERRQASSGVWGEQISLFDPPPFSPNLPPSSSLTSKALELLLKGCTLTHPEFEHLTGSWRLGAYILSLRDLGWPVQTIEIASPTKHAPDRVIAMYAMPKWVLQAMEA